MAPPRNTSPSASKKNKVTPTQVAFLVERYLADNGFSASLAAFRADAAHLFTKSAPVPPKGLLPLADILHDYVLLKEGRLAVDSAMHAMHNLVSAYYLNHPPPATPTLPPSPPAPLFAASSSSPPGPAAGYSSPMIHYTHTSSSLVVQNASEANTPTPNSLPTATLTNKRKATKSASASKKIRTAPTTTSHPRPKGKTAASQPSIDNPDQSINVDSAAVQPPPALMKLPGQVSSVAKSLFRPLQPQAHYSPCTPQQTQPVQGRPAVDQTERPSSVAANSHAQQELTSSQCSIVSSKTLIVSPLKGAAYYAVERSYHVSSPLKSSVQKSSKREHVKGKLDFGTPDVVPCSHEQICDQSSTSSEEEKQDEFDIDFTNFDIFDGDFSFSELLVDLDLDTEGFQCHNPSTSAEVQRLDPVPKSDNVTAVPVLPGSVKPLPEDPTEHIGSQAGPASVTSVRAITKRIKIVSPVKGHTAP
uniref:LisH domain-containing protein n=1 Tax=Leersia perrieri TaxID=77586 RepID=A0A0D9WUH7_9ORYZ